LKVPKVALVKVLVTAAIVVIKGMKGGALPSRKESDRPGEVPAFLSSGVLPTESLKLGENGVANVTQDEATKDDDAKVPFQLWDSWLEKKWDGFVCRL
jgi:hypothetical protein